MTMPNPYILTLISLLSAILLGGTGTSFLSVDRRKPELLIKEGGISALLLPIFISNPSVFVTSVLLGYFLALVVFILSMAEITAPFLDQLVIPVQILIQSFLALFIAAFTIFLARLSIFRVNPETSLRYLAIPSLLVYLLFFLFSVLILAILNLLYRPFAGKRQNIRKDGFFFTYTLPEFYSPLNLADSMKVSTLEEEPEVRIFQNALEFSKVKARDVMVPRNEIEALEVASGLEELKKKFIDSGYSKILVYEESIDNMIGYVSSKELFKNPAGIRSALVGLSVVPETMQINKLLQNLIRERRSIALVVDEYGGTSGIVTLEDIMEEIFGEIEDEHDTPEFVERQINEREFILSGRLEIDYLNEKYHLNIPETEDYDTLAGFIIFHHQNIPKLNTRVIVNNLQMRILKVSPARVDLVHITRSEAEK